ncbi:hypothetical protein PGB90_006675 [Kerria lacca]
MECSELLLSRPLLLKWPSPIQWVSDNPIRSSSSVSFSTIAWQSPAFLGSAFKVPDAWDVLTPDPPVIHFALANPDLAGAGG